MALIYPEAGDGSSDQVLSEAYEHFQRATSALNGFVRKLEAGDAEHSADGARILKDLKATLTTALAERERLESKRKEESGIVNDYAIDFDAARHEIGRRLACLRAADGAGRVSE